MSYSTVFRGAGTRTSRMGLYPSANPSLPNRDAQCLSSDWMSAGPGASYQTAVLSTGAVPDAGWVSCLHAYTR